MFKRRTPPNATFRSQSLNKQTFTNDEITIKKEDIDDSINSHEENLDNSVQNKIQIVRHLHRLKKKTKGLAITNDVYDTARQQLVEDFKPTRETEDLRRFGLLDKSFQSQACRTETIVDEHLEKFLAERLQETYGPFLSDDAPKGDETNLVEQELEKKLFEIPDRLKVENTAEHEKDKMTWVTGLMEIPLTLEAKLKNIEDTERAKRLVLVSSGIVPPLQPSYDTLIPGSTNQGNLNDQYKPDAQAVRAAFGQRFQVYESKKTTTMATDDVLLDKFRKRMRKL